MSDVSDRFGHSVPPDFSSVVGVGETGIAPRNGSGKMIAVKGEGYLRCGAGTLDCVFLILPCRPASLWSDLGGGMGTH